MYFSKGVLCGFRIFYYLFFFYLELLYGMELEDSSDGKTMYFFFKLLSGVLWTWTDTKYTMEKKENKKRI